MSVSGFAVDPRALAESAGALSQAVLRDVGPGAAAALSQSVVAGLGVLPGTELGEAMGRSASAASDCLSAAELAGGGLAQALLSASQNYAATESSVASAMQGTGP